MLMEQTLRTLKALRLPGMAAAFEEQQHQAAMAELSFDERVGLLVEREHTWRENRRLTRLLREAKLKSSQACVEDIRYGNGRKLDKSLMAQLSTCQWIHQHQNLVLTGATGCGKTWLACAFAAQACRLRLAATFCRASQLFADIGVAVLDGSLPRLKLALTKPTLLVIDDLGVGEMSLQAAHVLLEVVDRRMRNGSLLITSQYPTDQWHGFFPDPTIADAVLDRVIHQSHRITLKGESMRRLRAKRQMQE